MKKVLFALFTLVALVIVLGLALPMQADVVPTIWTGKADYAPEETVTIYGVGFEPGGQLAVELTRPDGWVDAWSVTADNGGAFETSYLLDGIEGLYTIMATDGSNTATTTFTDSKFQYSIAIELIMGGPGSTPPSYYSPISLEGTANATPYIGQYEHHYVQVDWGDGSQPEQVTHTEVAHDPTEKTFLWIWESSESHAYAAGEYTITATLVHRQPGGKEGAAAEADVTINIVNSPPVAVDDAYSVDEDTILSVVALGVLGNDTDVNADPLTAVLDDDVNDGTLTLNDDGSFTYDPDPGFHGIDSFTYHANDGIADSSTATVTITVNPVNDAPVAVDDAYSVDEDNTLNEAAPGVLCNDTDVEGDTLTAVLDSGVGNGTLTLYGNGSFIYDPAADFYGVDSFTYYANDGTDDSGTATVTITVNPVNDVPVAVDDAYSVDRDNTLNVAAPGVLGNDTDVDGDPLTAVLDSDVSAGTLTLNGNGSFIYDPAAGFYGIDSFTYTASDGKGGTDMATVTITVDSVNNAPVAANDSATTDENTPVNIDVLSNDSDPDGDTMMVTAVSDPPHGSAVINLNYTVTYTPDLNYNGSDSFTYTVSDGTDTDTGTVNITVESAPSPPVYGGPGFVASVLMSVRVTPEVATIEVGEAQRFRAVAIYSDNTTRNVTGEATWVSSDNDVATVYSGLATGVAEGTTGITATLGGETSNEAILSVTAPVVVSVEVAPQSGTIGVGDTMQFTATATYSNGSTADVTAEASWASSYNYVATVGAGLATGVAEGSTEIRATFDAVTSDAVTLNVTTAAVVSVEVTLESDTIGVGDTVQFTATATYSDGTTVDITGQAAWSSSDPDVVTIDAEGLATGEGAGTAEIAATLDGITSDPVTLTVTGGGAALQWWAILAIVAGSLALALLLFMIMMLWRRRRLAT